MSHIHLIDQNAWLSFHIFLSIVIALFLVIVIGTFWGNYKKMIDDDTFGATIAASFVIGATVIGFGGIVFSSLDSQKISDFLDKQPTKIKIVNDVSLISLKNLDKTGNSGSAIGGAILGTGLYVSNYKTDSQSYYQYIVNTALGYQVKTMQSDGKKIYFKESSGQKPQLITWMRVYSDPKIEKSYPYWDNNEDQNVNDKESDSVYQFIIPKGSVVRDYKIQ